MFGDFWKVLRGCGTAGSQVVLGLLTNERIQLSSSSLLSKYYVSVNQTLQTEHNDLNGTCHVLYVMLLTNGQRTEGQFHQRTPFAADESKSIFPTLTLTRLDLPLHGT